jgi:CheY-like chemotaxis protein
MHKGNYTQKKPKKILVVEDNELVRKILLKNIQIGKIKAEIYVAVDGKEAIQLYSEHKDIDLVLLDIGLPDINGIDVCKKMRKRKRNSPIIIFFTAYGNHYETECLEAGADYVYAKPYPKNLISIIHDALEYGFVHER